MQQISNKIFEPLNTDTVIATIEIRESQLNLVCDQFLSNIQVQENHDHVSEIELNKAKETFKQNVNMQLCDIGVLKELIPNILGMLCNIQIAEIHNRSLKESK